MCFFCGGGVGFHLEKPSEILRGLRKSGGRGGAPGADARDPLGNWGQRRNWGVRGELGCPRGPGGRCVRAVIRAARSELLVFPLAAGALLSSKSVSGMLEAGI